jgi:quercetin dioxygenase-like cupin family protein
MRVRWLVCAATSGSTALVVATSTFAPDGRHELHRHASAEEFFMVVEGGGEHLTESGPVRLGPGDAVLIPAGEWHGYRTDPGVTTRTIYGYLGAASLDDAGYEVRA